MNFDYSEKEWTVGEFTYLSPPSIGAWELALYREKLQEAILKSPLGKKIPAQNTPMFAKAFSDAMNEYSVRYPKFAALIACDCILRPADGSPPFEEAIKGLDLVQVVTDLTPLVAFFFKSVESSMLKQSESPRTGKASRATRKGSRSATTSRRSTANATS